MQASGVTHTRLKRVGINRHSVLCLLYDLVYFLIILSLSEKRANTAIGNTAQIMAGQGIPVYQYVFSRASPYTFVFCSTCIESKYTLYQAGIE